MAIKVFKSDMVRYVTDKIDSYREILEVGVSSQLESLLIGAIEECAKDGATMSYYRNAMRRKSIDYALSYQQSVLGEFLSANSTLLGIKKNLKERSAVWVERKKIRTKRKEKPNLEKKSRVNPLSDSFLFSYEWRCLRMDAFAKYGNKCQCCGAGPADGAVLNVDHVKPRKLFPGLALDINNLQILCKACNHGKANRDFDFRNSVSRSNN